MPLLPLWLLLCAVAARPGCIETVAGGGSGVPPLFSEPSFMTLDATQSIVFSAGNGVYRAVDGTTTGGVMQLAGGKAPGSSGDGLPAFAAKMTSPRGICLLPSGDIVVSDSGNNRLRRLAKDLNIYAFAGSGVAGFAGDGGEALAGKLSAPWDLECAPDGGVYVADKSNHAIRHISPPINGLRTLSTLAGKGRRGWGGMAPPASSPPRR